MSIAKVVIPTGLLNVVGDTINLQEVAPDADGSKKSFCHDYVDTVEVVSAGNTFRVQERWNFWVGRNASNPFAGNKVYAKFKDEDGQWTSVSIPNSSSFTVEPDGFIVYNRSGSMINTSGNTVAKRSSALISNFHGEKYHEGYMVKRVLYISQKGIDACQASKAGQVRCWVSPSECLTFTFK